MEALQLVNLLLFLRIFFSWGGDLVLEGASQGFPLLKDHCILFRSLIPWRGNMLLGGEGGVIPPFLPLHETLGKNKLVHIQRILPKVVASVHVSSKYNN